jgi:hypothetical protein
VEIVSELGAVRFSTSTCSHCQHVTTIDSLRRLHEVTDVCRGCMRLVCLGCAGKPCRPWEQECERQEAEARLGARIERERWGCY